MTATFNPTPQFLKDAAAKHFLLMEYMAAEPGKHRTEAKSYFATTFVVEVFRQWLLITAGHVVNDIRTAIASGSLHYGFRLHDIGAGNSFGMSVPIPSFDPDEWAVIEGDPAGCDYAAWPIPNLIAKNLRAGGVTPINEAAWKDPAPNSTLTWLLVGAPNEAIRSMASSKQFKIVGLPLERCEAPREAKVKERRTFAQLVSRPGDQAQVNDIKGMSGGPIYEIRTKGCEISYWLIGIQSSWLPTSRIVSFCSAADFLDAIQAAITKVNGPRGSPQ